MIETVFSGAMALLLLWVAFKLIVNGLKMIFFLLLLLVGIGFYMGVIPFG